MLGNNHPRVYSRYRFAIVFFHYHATSLCCVWMWSHFKTGEGKISVFFISFCIVALGRRNEKQHTQQQQQQQSFIHTIQVPGEVEKRKKLQKTK